jgi:solute carrier family 35 (UDP-sugar transporter), member A1/2/3
LLSFLCEKKKKKKKPPSQDNLPGPVVAVLSQLKILTTAIFSVMLLKKSLSARQWIALVALIAGVASVQVSSMLGASDGHNADASEDKEENVVTGGLAALLAAMTSGFAGVYFEMVLKGSDMSVWVRNIHLALFGVVVAAFGILSQPK